MKKNIVSVVAMVVINLVITLFVPSSDAQTIALWSFDEQIGLYPSSVLSSTSENDYPLVLGMGGQIVEGKFGNALEPSDQPSIFIPEGPVTFGLARLPIAEGRSVEPMTWHNAHFAALMTSGENHLRKEVGFVQPTKTKLNLGGFDFTLEFWYMPTIDTGDYGIVFEIGTGPRGENDQVTALIVDKTLASFRLVNAASGCELLIQSDPDALKPGNKIWHHMSFVYSESEQRLRHYVDGKLQSVSATVKLISLHSGSEDYFSVGRDALWAHPLQGRIDEIHLVEGQLRSANFNPPESLAIPAAQKQITSESNASLPLLFGSLAESNLPIPLGSRKHLFIDDALIEKSQNVKFVVNPPRLEERVIDNIVGPYRKHLTVVEDEQGVIRIYNSVKNDYLQVVTSSDGIHFNSPELSKEFDGHRNISIPQPVGGLGNPFLDPNGVGKYKWKMITGYHNRGIFLYESADGYAWTRCRTAVLPFRSGTQSCTFYDDQRQLYVGYHRTGFLKTPGGATMRGSSLTQVKDIFEPWPFDPMSQEETWVASDTLPLREPQPWYLDNGPLTPGGFGLEFPLKFLPSDTLDPVGTDIYITKAEKYRWAPDTYFAFPIVYFHYESDGPVTRQILMHPDLNMGSGPVETQIAVSRDGVNWKRYTRSAYVGIGMFRGWDIHSSYIAHGMVLRDNEIWQYIHGLQEYHSAYEDDDEHRGVFRLVQRLDGFISLDSDYGDEGFIVTKLLLFKGNRLIVNIDTDAAGYAQVGFLDENDDEIPGYSVDNCVYINGDFFEKEVQWISNPHIVNVPYGSSIEELAAEASQKLIITSDLTELQGKPVKLVLRMRGSKLYSLQFIQK